MAVIVIAILVAILLVMFTLSELVQSIIGALIVDMLLTGIQAFLYLQLAETP